ncbi:MAG TPA: hypothetical protein VF903_03115 [Nitrospirota bacterium]
MKGEKGMQKLAGVALVLLFPVWAFGAEDRHADNIGRALEASTFSRTEQEDVKAKAAAAINAGVPAEDVEIIVSRAVRRGAGPGTINRFLEIGLSAKQSGLPAGPVLDRIEQGLSKGVPPERVTAASERLAEKLTAARPIVDALIRSGLTPRRGADREEAIESAGRALEKSIPPKAIEEMGAAVRSKRGSLPLFTSAANAAAYFAGSGMSAKTASHLVQKAVEQGSSERGLNAMMRRIDKEMKRGGKAEEIAAKMEHESMNGGGMGRHDMQEEMRTEPGKPGSGMGGMGGGMGEHRR